MVGQTISHYRVLDKLGEGGMGVVYRAEDTKLDRPVALKFLAPHLLRDEEGRTRFEREAKAAAKLDHPNICTVYEIDKAEGRTFIAMAFLEGRPLSERIQQGPLTLTEALSIGIQMAEGLEAAHAKGITHRDIKPDNIMLMAGSRGLVKLLDFGLAQFAGSSKFTREGTTLGTVNYMAPEQAAGGLTDYRADIWALGVVLYEMVAGQRPFRGEFDQAIVYSILNEPPEPLTAVRTGIPKELERIVNKCLAKRAEQRYQGVTDLLVDLQACRRGLEAQVSKVGVMPAAGKRPSPTLVAAAIAALLAVGAGVTWWAGLSASDGNPSAPQYNLVQITRDTGFTGQPSLSPDGRQLVYASDRDGEGSRDIYLQQIGGGDPLPLTTHEADDSQPSFSPDGDRVVFVSVREGGGIYVIPALGGSARRIADYGSSPMFSPDGAYVSFGQLEFDSTNRMGVNAWVVPSSGGEARRVATDLGSARPRAWSPDGRYLLVQGSEQPGEFGTALTFDWWLVPTDGGDAVNLGARSLFDESGLGTRQGVFPTPATWLAEEDSVVFSGRLRDGGAENLWRVAISVSDGRLVGEPQRLTSGTGERDPWASRDGRIVFVSGTTNWDIWALPLGANRATAEGEPMRVVASLSREMVPSFSRDGRRLVYLSDRSGNDDVWLRDLETGDDTQITVGPNPEFRAYISPDGNRVVFGRLVDGKTNIYVAEVRRGAERLLVEDVGGLMDWTPDGKKVLYYTNSPIRWNTVDMATGEHQDLGLEHPEFPVHNVRFSPSMESVTFTLRDGGLGNRTLFVAAVHEGKALPESEWKLVGQAEGNEFNHPWWSPDGATLFFSSPTDGFQCIWAQRLKPEAKEADGPPIAVRHFHDRLRLVALAAPLGYAMTADTLYLPLAELKANIWLAEPVSE